ncbi:MAG: heme lyase NrfEFG subunit NrfE [Proteobacteria bacterium]|nr:MAG: heme lyase NrfEFG subunit NrfE [Pseudomonadota bacterium]
MLPELGHFALVIALVIAIVQAVVPLWGTFNNNVTLMSYARPMAAGQFVFLLLSFICLCYAFLTDDFSVQYVANHSNSLLPDQYKLSAVWGGHEGSLLLWVLLLSVWTLAVALFSRSLPLDMLARVLSVMAMISIGFLLFVIMTSNPFDRYLPLFPQDGADLNPLLQDIGLILHPPMLYMGYVGFSVAFAFAIAALISGHLDAVWARWSRPWTTVAWAFLTLGISLGSWWAYYELGWGGWWFWDPVENASLMPWLVGTALMHSLAVTEKRGMFKSWTVLLAIFAFSLSLLGTFLVRSGVLTSVHAFASDPERGTFILMLLAITVLGALLLYAFRVPTVHSRARHGLLSRETFLMLNNVLLIVAMMTVFLGTLYPLVLDFLGMGKISVGAPYFNAIFVPIVAVLVLVMGAGQFANWKDTRPERFRTELRLPGVISLVVALAIPFATDGKFNGYVAVGIFIAMWLTLSMFKDLFNKIRNQSNRWSAIVKLPRSYKGMFLGHIGLAVSIVGATMVSNYTVERDVRMSAGDFLEVAGYRFVVEGFEPAEGPNYEGERAIVQVFSGADNIARLIPEKRSYTVSRNVMTEAGIDAGLFRDIYVAMGEQLNGAWSMRVQIKPFVRWLWIGSLFMAFGGFLAIADKRYRVLSRRRAPVNREAVVDGKGVDSGADSAGSKA